MRSSVSRSERLSARVVRTKCQKSAATPRTGVAARLVSSLSMRNGERALRPRSEISSAIEAGVGSKTNYTLLARRIAARGEARRFWRLSPVVSPALCRERPRASECQSGCAHHGPQRQHVPKRQRRNRRRDEAIADGKQGDGGGKRQREQRGAGEARRADDPRRSRLDGKQDVTHQREPRKQYPGRDPWNCGADVKWRQEQDETRRDTQYHQNNPGEADHSNLLAAHRCSRRAWFGVDSRVNAGVNAAISWTGTIARVPSAACRRNRLCSRLQQYVPGP